MCAYCVSRIAFADHLGTHKGDIHERVWPVMKVFNPDFFRQTKPNDSGTIQCSPFQMLLFASFADSSAKQLPGSWKAKSVLLSPDFRFGKHSASLGGFGHKSASTHTLYVADAKSECYLC
jgi:hypothetical protein